MSLPNIPDIAPLIKLKHKDVVNLLLASIALEEISLSHIMNAESEKIQAALKEHRSFSDIDLLNRSMERTLRSVIKQQMLLQFKMEDILRLHAGEITEEEYFEEEEGGNTVEPDIEE